MLFHDGWLTTYFRTLAYNIFFTTANSHTIMTFFQDVVSRRYYIISRHISIVSRRILNHTLSRRKKTFVFKTFGSRRISGRFRQKYVLTIRRDCAFQLYVVTTRPDKVSWKHFTSLRTVHHDVFSGRSHFKRPDMRRGVPSWQQASW